MKFFRNKEKNIVAEDNEEIDKILQLKDLGYGVIDLCLNSHVGQISHSFLYALISQMEKHAES